MFFLECWTRGPSSLLASLRSLSNTLTELSLEYRHPLASKNRYRLCDVMEVCPNLVSIRMCCGDVDMSSVTKIYPKLVKLELRNQASNVYEGDMASVLHPFPQLRVLKLFSVSGSDIFPAIDQCCPLLQHLILSLQSRDFPHILDTPERPGLRALSVINNIDFGNFKEDDMVNYLMAHSETMEVLDITSHFAFRAPNDLLRREASQQVTFKQLRRISYPFDAQEGLVSFILWVIQRAPHLESIECVTGPQQVRIMQELIRPHHHACLKRLGMRPTRSTLEGEARLIQHHLDLGQQSNLRELKVSFPENFIHNSWLPLILQLTQLTTLELSARLDQGFVSWKPFMSKLADGCPGLEQLTMTNDSRTMNINAVNPMYRHSNLKRIVINCRAIYGDLSFFCQRFTKLDSLHLKVTKYNWEDIHRLERGSFKLVLTPKRARGPS